MMLTTFKLLSPDEGHKSSRDAEFNIQRQLEETLPTDAGHRYCQRSDSVQHPVIQALLGPLAVAVSHDLDESSYSNDAAAR